jgi:hypothetical protein
MNYPNQGVASIVGHYIGDISSLLHIDFATNEHSLCTCANNNYNAHTFTSLSVIIGETAAVGARFAGSLGSAKFAIASSSVAACPWGSYATQLSLPAGFTHGHCELLFFILFYI